MWWHLPLLLLDFLIDRLLGLPLAEALSEVLMQSWRLANLHQNIVCLLESTESEHSETNLDERSIVMDFVSALLLVDQLLELTSEEQGFGFSDAVVDSMMVHLEEDSSDSFSPGTVS